MKYFLTRSHSIKAKNKLCELVQEKIESLDFTLYPSLQLAKAAIAEKYDQALAEYTGRCTVAKPHYYDGGRKDSFGMSIEDVVYMSLYPVKQDETKKCEVENIAEMRFKAEKWDELDTKIGKFYGDDEDSEEPGDGLITIGEIAASALGYL